MLRRAIPLVALGLLLASSPRAHAEGGHDVRLLADGKTSFEARAANIREADVVFYKTYIFSNDRTGQDTMAELIARAKAGAQVYLQFDSRGTLGSAAKQIGVAYLHRSPIPAYLQPLIDAGVHVLPVNTPTIRRTFLGSDHEKLLVTWKRGEPARAIVGGMNVGDAWANGGYIHDAPPRTGHLDTDLELSGPQVSRVLDRFIDAARRQKMPVDGMTRIADEMKQAPETFGKQAGDSHVRFFSNDPKEGNNPRRLERLYAKLLRSTPAGETVEISNPYIIPSRGFRKELIAAGQRGVKIKMLVNEEKQSELSMGITAFALRADLRTMFKKMPKGTLEVYEWGGDKARNEGSIHEKVASFGKKGPVVIGSFNLDPISANTNSEEATVVHDAKLRRGFDHMMSRSFKLARPLTASMLKKQPLWRRAAQRVVRTALGRVL